MLMFDCSFKVDSEAGMSVETKTEKENVTN